MINHMLETAHTIIKSLVHCQEQQGGYCYRNVHGYLCEWLVHADSEAPLVYWPEDEMKE